MKKVLYLGFNGFKDHKRGVENVIEFQSKVLGDFCYYIHWGDITKLYKNGSFICLSVNKRTLFKYLVVNLFIYKLRKRYKKVLFIHSHNYLMSFFLQYKSDLFTVHDGLYYQNRAIGSSRLKLLVFRCIEKILYIKCRCVHFISEFTKKNSLYSGIPTTYQLIYNTSNFEKEVDIVEYNENLFHQKYPFLSSKNYCFLVRSIEERARIDLVLEVSKKKTDLNFVIAGKGPLLDYYKDRVRKENITNVFLLGFVPDYDLFMLYAGSSFVMVPAEHGEGFGLPIIEGYLFNKPVIASAKCAIPEVLMNDTYLFDNNVDSVVNAINRLPSSFGGYRDYYDQRFSNRAILNQYSNLYKQCMK